MTKQISTELYDALQKEFGAKEASHFTDNGDGTITDTKENLMWEKTPSKDQFTWQEAMDMANERELAGHSDWRLPTIHELFSLVDYSKTKAYLIDDVFDINDDYSWYWSSTTHPNDTSSAMGAGFGSGAVDSGSKAALYSVRLVRQI